MATYGRRDNLRFMAARDATQLALKKWERIAFGTDSLENESLKGKAREIHAELTATLAKLSLLA